MLQFCFYVINWLHFPSRLPREREGIETNQLLSFLIFSSVLELQSTFFPKMSILPGCLLRESSGGAGVREVGMGVLGRASCPPVAA